MSYLIGTLLKNGGDDAHYQLLDVIKTEAESVGWITQRYVNTGLDREWIGKSTGFSGTEEIFIGIKTYQNSSSDYYNFNCATLTGYVSGNDFETQPGYKNSGCPAHNNAISYFININPQRIVACLKVGTPVYTHFYLGKIFPYSRPGEFPSPLVAASMFNGAELKRFSDSAQIMPYYGYYYDNLSYLWLRIQSGNWVRVWAYPYSNKDSSNNTLGSGTNVLFPADSGVDEYYQLEPIIINQLDNTLERSNVYGELDGVFFVSGFNNGVENVIQIGGSGIVDQTGLTVLEAVDSILLVGGRAFVVCQDVTRTAFNSFVALEMN